jgi:hypothetical protein
VSGGYCGAIDLVSVLCKVRHSGPGSYEAVSEYSSNLLMLVVGPAIVPLSWDFSAYRLALLGSVNQRLPEQSEPWSLALESLAQ